MVVVNKRKCKRIILTILSALLLLHKSVHATHRKGDVLAPKSEVVDWTSFDTKMPICIENVKQQKNNNYLMWVGLGEFNGKNTTINLLLKNELLDNKIKKGKDSDDDSDDDSDSDDHDLLFENLKKGPKIGKKPVRLHPTSYWDDSLKLYHTVFPKLGSSGGSAAQDLCAFLSTKAMIQEAQQVKGMVFVISYHQIKDPRSFRKLYYIFKNMFKSPSAFLKGTTFVFTKNKPEKFVSFFAKYLKNRIGAMHISSSSLNEETKELNSFILRLFSHVFNMASHIEEIESKLNELKKTQPITKTKVNQVWKPLNKKIRNQIKENLLCIYNPLTLSFDKEDGMLIKIQKALKKSDPIPKSKIQIVPYNQEQLNQLYKRLKDFASNILTPSKEFSEIKEKAMKVSNPSKNKENLTFFSRANAERGIVGVVVAVVVAGGGVAAGLSFLSLLGVGTLGFIAGCCFYNENVDSTFSNIKDFLAGKSTLSERESYEKVIQLNTTLTTYLQLNQWVSFDKEVVKRLKEAQIELSEIIDPTPSLIKSTSDLLEDNEKKEQA